VKAASSNRQQLKPLAEIQRNRNEYRKYQRINGENEKAKGNKMKKISNKWRRTWQNENNRHGAWRVCIGIIARRVLAPRCCASLSW